MTDYASYDAGLPCKNPHCSSHGKPHPNCRCWNMAEGGEVEPFCSSERMHHKECEYYTDQMPAPKDHHLSMAAYLSHAGLHGLIDIGKKSIGAGTEKYDQAVKRGHKAFERSMGHLFGEGSPEDIDHTKAHEMIHDWVESGGPLNDLVEDYHEQNSPEHFAKGGEVKHKKHAIHDPEVTQAYPEQNLMLQAAKGRMHDYLNSLKPQKFAPKLAFDDEPDNRQQEKSYKRAVNLAAHPLGILDRIKRGTIEPEHVKHFKNLHPEVDSVLQKKLTEEITKAQLKGEKPSFKVRQGMSLLLGVPLSGELSPQNIQAAQATFQTKQPQQPQGAPITKNKKNTSTLTKADDSFLTSNQARTARQQKQ